MPPVFLAAGYRDRPDIAEGLANLYLKYKAVKIPAELHIFAKCRARFRLSARCQTQRCGPLARTLHRVAWRQWIIEVASRRLPP